MYLRWLIYIQKLSEVGTNQFLNPQLIINVLLDYGECVYFNRLTCTIQQLLNTILASTKWSYKKNSMVILLSKPRLKVKLCAFHGLECRYYNFYNKRNSHSFSWFINLSLITFLLSPTDEFCVISCEKISSEIKICSKTQTIVLNCGQMRL